MSTPCSWQQTSAWTAFAPRSGCRTATATPPPRSPSPPPPAGVADATLAQVAAAIAAIKAVAAAPSHVRAAADAVAHLLAAAFAPDATDAAVRAALADVCAAVPAARRLAAAPSVAYVAGTYRHAHAALVASPSYERAVSLAAASLGRLSASGVGRALLAPGAPAARLAAAPAIAALADHLKPVATTTRGDRIAGGEGDSDGSPRCVPAGRGGARARGGGADVRSVLREKKQRERDECLSVPPHPYPPLLPR